MTPGAFCTWLAAMKAAGIVRSDAEAARLLGFRDVDRQKKRGGDQRLALACAAVMAGIGPWQPPDGGG